MTPTAKRKALAAVLVLGGGAVAADRLLLAPSEDAESEDLLVAGAGAVAAGPPRAAVISVTRQIRALADLDAGRSGAESDAFAIPAAWIPAAPEPDPTGAHPAAAAPSPWAGGHAPRLTAVMCPKSGEGPAFAVIDGRRLEVGDAVAGCRIVAIETDRVVFEASTGPVLLMLAGASQGL